MLLRRDLLFVLLQRHHTIELRARCGLDLDQPALLVRFGGDDRRVVEHLRVYRGNYATDRGIEVADRLDRLDLAEALTGGDLLADVRQRQVNDVGELIDGALGDADGAGVAVEAGPLVRGG